MGWMKLISSGKETLVQWERAHIPAKTPAKPVLVLFVLVEFCFCLMYFLLKQNNHCEMTEKFVQLEKTKTFSLGKN